MVPILMVVGDNSIHDIVIQKAQQLGMQVLLVSRNRKTPLARMANFFECIDDLNFHIVEQIARKYRISGSMTRIEDNVPIVCAVNEALNLPRQGSGIGQAVTDKSVMRECFQRDGVSSPNYMKIENEQQLQSASEWVKTDLERTSFIVKPTDRASSVGITRITDFAQFQNAVHRARKFGRSGKIVVEQFVEGIDIHATGFSVDGELALCFISKKTVTSTFTSLGHSLPFPLPEQQLDLIREECRRALTSLGIRYGPSTIDMKLDKDGMPYMIEIGARLGATRLPELIQEHSGIDLVEAVIRQTVGEDISFPSPLNLTVSSLLIYFDRPAKIKRMNSYQNLIQEYNPIQYEINLRNNMKVSPDIRNYGYVICQGENAQNAERDCASFMLELRKCIEFA